MPEETEKEEIIPEIQLPEITQPEVSPTGGMVIPAWSPRGFWAEARNKELRFMPRQTLKFATCFETTGRFGTAKGLTGDSVFDANGLQIYSGATANSYCKRSLTSPVAITNVFKDALMTTVIHLDTLGALNGDFFIGVSESLTVAGGGITFTGRHFGFSIVKASGVATLYATNADGTTQKTTDLGSIAEGTQITLFAFNDGQIIKFYKNGTMVASHKDNIPTGNYATVGEISITNKNTASDFIMRIASYCYEKFIE